MNKTVFQVALWMIAGMIAGATTLADQGADKFRGPWVITKIDVGEPPVGQEPEFSGLKVGDEIESAPEWFGQGESDFGVPNGGWFHPFETFTWHRVERNGPLPKCSELTDDVDLLLSVPINAMVAVGHVEHEDEAADHLEDAHLMIFIPCKSPSDKDEFRIVVRSFVEGTGGGGVTHNGMIHGSGKV